MKIAFIGWGSLIWRPEELKIRSPWYKDGPLLPVEFMRVSKDGRLTLVLQKNAPLVQTLWAHASCANLNEAIRSLREREGTTAQRIGYVSLASGNFRCRVVEEIAETVADWARGKALDAAVWTDLSSNFLECTGMDFTNENAIVYLRGLGGNKLTVAKQYIMNVPGQVRTPLRQFIEDELEW